jgi:hypothetical protein
MTYKWSKDFNCDLVSKSLWLANIREDKLYSIVWLGYYSSFFGKDSFSRTQIALIQVLEKGDWEFYTDKLEKKDK